MIDILNIIQRNRTLFEEDFEENKKELNDKIKSANFLVIGGAGSIGREVTIEIFIRNPRKLHVVDISENNLVELVRLLRTKYGYIDGDFRTFTIDSGSIEFEVLFENEGPYDYVLNLSALKHVRSERDPYTLMQMINVNILNAIKNIEQSISNGVKKYFAVSTDKASSPINLMGASKKIMELYMGSYKDEINISSARFANVAFSDGSLLDSFLKRFHAKQPLSGPTGIKRYFITPKESDQLCLLSTIMGRNNELFIPKTKNKLYPISFEVIAKNFLKSMGFEPIIFQSENKAKNNFNRLFNENKWACCFKESDTTGEKELEEFYSVNDNIDKNRFYSINVIKPEEVIREKELKNFLLNIKSYKKKKKWSKNKLISEIKKIILDFNHIELGKSLDQKM